MRDLQDALKRWHLDAHQVRERMYRALTPRERGRWHALWLLARGWSAAEVADALACAPSGAGRRPATAAMPSDQGDLFARHRGHQPPFRAGR